MSQNIGIVISEEGSKLHPIKQLDLNTIHKVIIKKRYYFTDLENKNRL